MFARLTVCLLAFATLTLQGATQQEGHEFFEKKVRPILVEHCYSCHSSTAEKVKGGLLLDSAAGVKKGGESGAVIVPGDPEKSLFITAVRYTDKELQMPPKDKKLSDTQIAALEEWVKMGAPDPRTETPIPVATAHAEFDFKSARTNWAFRVPQDPLIPKIKNSKWAMSPVDQFILAKLEEKALRPAAPADKRTLIRRATFDLIGLPPTQQEIDNFIGDKSPGAFAKVIDRLLASPHYGERWGRHWLDVVRYADSVDARVTGGAEDFADAWRYRDWIVNAFNNDLPYDEFIMQQVAGDLLPAPKADEINTNAIIATGMYAIGNWGNGDADKDKVLTDIADDAVDVTGRAFLGLTLACARCHDHKFDPIPTADYYSMAGIFFSSHIIPKLTPKGAGEAMLRIPLISKAETERRKQRETRMAELEKEIEAIQDEQTVALAKDVLPHTEQYLLAVTQLQNTGAARNVTEVATASGLNAQVLQRWLDFLGADQAGLLTKGVSNLLDKRGLHAWRNSRNDDTPSAVANATDQEIPFLSIKLPARRVAIHPSPKNGVAVGWKSPISGIVNVRGRVLDVDPNCGDGIDWVLNKVSKGTEEMLLKGAIASGGEQPIASGAFTVKAGETLQVAVFPKGGYECDTTMVEFEVTEQEGQKRTWNFHQDVTGDFLAGNPHADSYGNAAVWHLRDLADSKIVPDDSALARWLRTEGVRESSLAKSVQDEITSPTTNSPIYSLFAVPRGAFWAPLRNDASASTPEIKRKITDAKSELARIRSNPPPPIEFANGLQEGGVPESPHAGVHDVRIHVRGKYDRLGEIAPRQFPRVLAGDTQQPITNGSGRLELAKWLSSPTNPLTARVMVNRIWQHHFGEGIVRTPNNYGKLGTPPTNPELLDFLAHRFVESGWSIKQLHRTLMLSAVYQQSSIPREKTLQADPENLLFGRMNRRRLDAESFRDSILFAAGQLDTNSGGPATRELNNRRRTLYLMMIRSDRSNYRMLFDAADPNSIVEQRVVSTVAPQALFLLNHDFVLGQVASLADRAAAINASDDKRINWLYSTLYGRDATSVELKIGRRALQQARAELNKDEKLAIQAYCQVLLCANEFVYVD